VESEEMRVVAITLAALALASAGAAAPSGLASGLRGVVMRGPIKPVCFEGEPCEEPAAGVTLRFTRAGTVVARVKTGPAGDYTVRLRPGVYTVAVLPFRLGTALTPRRVRVPERRLARIDFHLDTGIQ
jgi:hypothetical protein